MNITITLTGQEALDYIKSRPAPEEPQFKDQTPFDEPKHHRKNWTSGELQIISYCTDPKSSAAPSQRKFHTLVARLPTRSESAIKTCLYKHGIKLDKEDTLKIFDKSRFSKLTKESK